MCSSSDLIKSEPLCAGASRAQIPCSKRSRCLSGDDDDDDDERSETRSNGTTARSQSGGVRRSVKARWQCVVSCDSLQPAVKVKVEVEVEVEVEIGGEVEVEGSAIRKTDRRSQAKVIAKQSNRQTEADRRIFIMYSSVGRLLKSALYNVPQSGSAGSGAHDPSGRRTGKWAGRVGIDADAIRIGSSAQATGSARRTGTGRGARH